MLDPNDSLWTEFQNRRDRYSREAENARLINEGQDMAAEDAPAQGRGLASLASAAVKFLLHWHRRTPGRAHPSSIAGR